MIFPLLHQSSAVPADLRVFPPVSGRKFPYGEIFCRKNAPNARVTDGKIDSEGENCDRRSACATRKRTVREPLFMPYPGMRPLSSPAVVKALLLPLHCMYGWFCPYPRPPVLLLFRQPTILSLPCNPPQNQHRRINCMKTGTLPVSNPISAPSAISRIAVLIPHP